MDRLVYLVILFLFTSCAKEGTEESYINLSEYEIYTSETGAEMKIEVLSNCEWSITDIPQWCIIDITNGEFNAKLTLRIIPNSANSTRKAYVKIFGNGVTEYLYIEQDRSTKGYDIKWFSFPVNIFTTVNYTHMGDETGRIYVLKGTKIFANASIKSKLYLGNIINKISDNLLNIEDYPEYTYNPITIGSFVDGKAYIKTIYRPSLSELDILANEIIRIKQNQILNFSFDDTPISYSSHRQLYLLGKGNLGVDLDRLIFGYSYTEKEMVRQTGLIYSYCNTLFNIIMDIPEKLVNENIIDRNLAYVSNLNYGRIGLLIIESDYNYNLLSRTIKKVMKEERLSNEETIIIEQSSIYYLYFNNSGDIIKREGEIEAIRDYINSINESDIIPLSFSINNCIDNHVEEVEYKVLLP